MLPPDRYLGITVGELSRPGRLWRRGTALQRRPDRLLHAEPLPTDLAGLLGLLDGPTTRAFSLLTLSNTRYLDELPTVLDRDGTIARTGDQPVVGHMLGVESMAVQFQRRR